MCETIPALLNEAMSWPSWPLYEQRYPRLRGMAHPCMPKGNLLDRNAFVACTGESEQYTVNLTSAAPLPVVWGSTKGPYGQGGCDAPGHNFVSASMANAGFGSADPLRARDFSLRASSPVWRATGWTRQLPQHFGPL